MKLANNQFQSSGYVYSVSSRSVCLKRTEIVLTLHSYRNKNASKQIHRVSTQIVFTYSSITIIGRVEKRSEECHLCVTHSGR